MVRAASAEMPRDAKSVDDTLTTPASDPIYQGRRVNALQIPRKASNRPKPTRTFTSVCVWLDRKVVATLRILGACPDFAHESSPD